MALSEALQIVENFRKNPQALTSQGGSFERGAFDKILAQSGCEKINLYCAQKPNGNFTVVLVGVDAAGKDMTASVMEKQYPCPPYCDQSSTLIE